MRVLPVRATASLTLAMPVLLVRGMASPTLAMPVLLARMRRKAHRRAAAAKVVAVVKAKANEDRQPLNGVARKPAPGLQGLPEEVPTPQSCHLMALRTWADDDRGCNVQDCPCYSSVNWPSARNFW